MSCYKVAMSRGFHVERVHTLFNVKIARFRVRKLHFSQVIQPIFTKKAHRIFEYEHFS